MDRRGDFDVADIADTGDLTEDDNVREHLVATTESEPKEKIEFFVQMRSWTARDMEELVVEAAARLLVGKFGDNVLGKDIQERCKVLLTEKADAVLSGVTSEIIDQPLTPSFGDKKPVTMREFLGLYGREYLEQRVGKYDGKVGSSSYDTMPRMAYLVSQHLNTKFEKEMSAAVSKAVTEIQMSVQAKLNATLESEKARVREALDKLAAPKAA
jgi:hypothetical protein